MSPQIKPIKIYGQGPSPNPFKVIIILKELGLPYEEVPVAYSDIKKPDYVALNPNGRLPTIYDPNSDITLWESGPIIEYLTERYDTENRLSFPAGTPEYYHAKQWLSFQMSGQGPYYGQLTWFVKFHEEKVPSAIARYAKEINRVTGVLDSHLAKQKEKYANSLGDGPWLVGGKLTYVDLAWLPWQRMASMFATKDQYDDEKYPHAKEWYTKMVNRKSVIDAIKESPAPPS
jgi:glutathione S-transferase